MAEVLAILKAIQSGNENAFAELLSQYQPLIQKMAQSFLNACPELDREDLIQEASLALSNAAKHYRLDETGVTFGLYAKICIKNRLISIVRKHRKTVQTPTVTVRKAAGPKVKLALPKDFSLEECRALLSRFENQVLTLYAEGHSYSEMAQELSCSVKSIDNAIYRIKSKIRALVPPNS